MNISETMVYYTLVYKINKYQMTHAAAPVRIQMNKATNKKLAQERCSLTGTDSILSIEVIFGMKIEIVDDMYNNQIIILGSKKKTK
jgi:hypothetical protein